MGYIKDLYKSISYDINEGIGSVIRTIGMILLAAIGMAIVLGPVYILIHFIVKFR